MFKKKVKEIEVSQDEKILTSKNYNEDRTMAFRVKKVAHKKDSIAWMVGSVLMFVFLVMSLGRLTIIGQFFDDSIFNILFGWFKFPVYLILFGVDISILLGLKFKFKKRFLAMIILTSLILSWFITTSLMIDLNVKHEGIDLWSKDMFTKVINTYTKDWLDHSIYGEGFKNAANSKFGIYHDGYATVYSGGGIFGAILIGLFGYTSLPFSLILAIFALFLDIVWILTGNPIYFFLPKDKRRGKGIRILSLKYNDNPHANKKVETIKSVEAIETNSTKSKWDEINVFNENPNYIESEVRDADLTIEFGRRNKNIEEDTFNFEEDDIFKTFGTEQSKENDHEKLRQQMLEEEKKRFENLNPDEARKEFEKNYASARPFGHNIKDKTIETFNEFEEDAMDDTDFFNQILSDEPNDDLTFKIDNTISHEKEIEKTIKVEEPKEKEPFYEKINNKYKVPSIDLLNDVKIDPEAEERNRKEAEAKTEAINNTFEVFNVGAKVVNVITGPTVTKFEIQPEPGTKVNSISALENDLKLALASQNIRLEAPIQGKNLVGIEIENKSPSMVGLKEMIKNAPKDKDDSKLLFALGKNVLGEPVFGELNKMPHLLVAGSTGSGKSVMINTLIVSILLRAKPHEVKFLMIDPKKVELSVYSNLPHMLAPVISDMKDANNALKAVIAEMDRRYDLFAEHNAKNIESYNSKMPKEKHLPYYVVIVDELADLMMTANKKDVEDSIMRITQMARAAGIHLIVATQRPSVDVITGVIKSNIPTRIAFSVTTGGDSRTILDTVGAEKLIGKGDMLYAPPGSSELIRAQGAYLSDGEIEKIVDDITAQQQVVYYETFTKLDEPSNSSGNGGEKDELYEEVKQWVIQNGKASTSLVQRKFSIGYNKAANIIDQLEANGVIGPNNGSKPREVLIKK